MLYNDFLESFTVWKCVRRIPLHTTVAICVLTQAFVRKQESDLGGVAMLLLDGLRN